MPEPIAPETIAANLKSDMAALLAKIEAQENTIKALESTAAESRNLLTEMRRSGAFNKRSRQPGRVSDEAAAHMGAIAIATLSEQNKLGTFAGQRAAPLAKEAEDILQRSPTALSTSNVGLPIEYGRELQELIAEYGVARRALTRYPMGMGVARPARLTTGLTAFTFMAHSAEFDSKSLTAGYASLESHKAGGIVTVPRELMQQGAVDIGQYLMTYGAMRFGEKEDFVAFLSDGTADATDDSITGICATAAANSKLVTLAGGETSPDDVTIDHIAQVMAKVATPAMAKGKFYLNPTFQVKLPALNTQAHRYYEPLAPGGPTLYGKPIVWTDTLQAWTADAAASTYPVVFGDLSWWWFGEHGVPMIDTSIEVRFLNDEIVFRFIEEFDVDYNSLNAVAVIKTAAS